MAEFYTPGAGFRQGHKQEKSINIKAAVLSRAVFPDVRSVRKGLLFRVSPYLPKHVKFPPGVFFGQGGLRLGEREGFGAIARLLFSESVKGDMNC